MSEKEFDITQHEWSDAAKESAINFYTPVWVGGDLQIVIRDAYTKLDDILQREHAVAIAKHFKLTAEDLERG